MSLYENRKEQAKSLNSVPAIDQLNSGLGQIAGSATERNPEMAQKLSYLSASVDQLDRRLADLIRRLEPISCVKTNQKDAPRATAPSATKIGGLIQTQIDRIQQFDDAIAGLLESLEI